MSEKCYAVAFGYKRGLFEKLSDCHKQIIGFPRAVYKKFESREKAQQYLDARKPLTVTFDVDKKAKVLYAVARGSSAGIFEKYDLVKEHIKSFPQPMYKKFSNFKDAKAYYDKFANGVEVAAAKSSVKLTSTKVNSKHIKSIARKRTHDNTENEEDEASNKSTDEDNSEDNIEIKEKSKTTITKTKQKSNAGAKSVKKKKKIA